MRTPLAALFPIVAAAAQQGPPPAVEWRCGDQLVQQLSAPKPWVQLLDRDTLAIGRYRLPAGGEDGQRPHDRDEVYYVVAGKARFTADGATRDVGKGDIVFVAADAKHHFHDVTEDLDLLVMFANGVPRSGGMIAGPKPTEQTPFPETSARGATRIFYWFGPNSAGQVHVGYGRPRWQGSYASFLKQASGKRWRLGEDFWTTLDTNMALQIGGVDVPVGGYYAVLQHVAERGLELVLLDPDQVREQRLDAWEAFRTTGGIPIPMQREKAARASGRLQIELTVDRGQRDRGKLEITFGEHVLHAPVLMKPRR